MTVDPQAESRVLPEAVADAEWRMVSKIRDAIPVILATGTAIDEWNAARADAGHPRGRVTVAMQLLENFSELVQSGGKPTHADLEGLLQALSGEHYEAVHGTFSSDEINRFIQYETLLSNLTAAAAVGKGPFAQCDRRQEPASEWQSAAGHLEE